MQGTSPSFSGGGMSVKKLRYGKVFISHSSVNKPFVRKLAKAIEADGFQVWLDEKELLPGDALARRVSEGVMQASAVIVVVSQAAIASKWLAFELNKAAARMVNGECVVIPVVMEAVERLPAEVEGLLYADFSKSYKRPMRAVLNALNSDVERRIVDQHFYMRVEGVLERVFDSRGYSSTDTEYKSDDESIVYFKDGEGREHTAAYDTLAAYGEPKPFTDRGVAEVARVASDSTEMLRLIVSERPIKAKNLTPTEHPNVSVLREGGSRDSYWYVVFADVSSTSDEAEWMPILAAARRVLEEKVVELAVSSAARRRMWARGNLPTLREALGLDAKS